MKTLTLTTCALTLSSLVLVQMGTAADARSRHKKHGMSVTSSQSTTGGRPGRTMSRGATGAETSTSNSAAGGNSGQPSRASGTGSAGGGAGGGL